MRRAVLAVTGIAVGTPLLVALRLGPAPQAQAAADAARAGVSRQAAGAAGGTGARAPGAKATGDPAAPPPASDPGGEQVTGPKPTKPPKAGAPPAAGGAKRTVLGTPQETPYGTVRVQVVLAGNKITDVQAVNLPQTEPRSISLNERAVPKLREEVLAKQSATVDTVSGATFTSEGYLNSLQEALDSARA